MAKALFHKNQRVYVKPVGTWALIERVIPHWVKDVQEPLRVTYDVGLGREFTGGELVSETTMKKRDLGPGVDPDEGELNHQNWRIFRMRNKWHGGEAQANHPFPGTFPVVVTDDQDWGGWRVPGAEYDRDPGRIEYQARLMVVAPEMLRLIKRLVELGAEQPDNLPDEMIQDVRRGAAILREVYEIVDDELVAAQ